MKNEIRKNLFITECKALNEQCTTLTKEMEAFMSNDLDCMSVGLVILVTSDTYSSQKGLFTGSSENEYLRNISKNEYPDYHISIEYPRRNVMSLYVQVHTLKIKRRISAGEVGRICRTFSIPEIYDSENQLYISPTGCRGIKNICIEKQLKWRGGQANGFQYSVELEINVVNK